MKSLFLILISAVLISCGGGGGRPGTCFGSAQVCGDGSATSNSAVNGTTSVSQGIGASGSFLVEYVISGTTAEASVVLFTNAQSLTEQRVNVRLPYTLAFNRDPNDYLAVSAQNSSSSGAIKVTIKINGIEHRTDQSTSAFGTAFAYMTCCQ